METIKKYEQSIGTAEGVPSLNNSKGQAYYVENYYGYTKSEIAKMKLKENNSVANYYLANGEKMEE